jgi:hypothetical protein
MLRQSVFNVLSLAALLCLGTGAESLDAAANPDPALRSQEAPYRTCVDGDGGHYSANAVVKVTDQVQQCRDGLWTFPAENPPSNAAMLAKQKSCTSPAEPDKGQAYGSGVLRKAGDTVERCDDGKWVKR